MGSVALLCNGTAVRRVEHGVGCAVQGFGHFGRADRLLDLAHHVAVDDQVLMEPTVGASPHQKVLGRGDAARDRRTVRSRCSGAAPADVLRCYGGIVRRYRIQRCHA